MYGPMLGGPGSTMSLTWSSRLHDKVVFVTGASSGIGAAAAQLFA